MIYGKEKHLQMARSILPCTRREAAAFHKNAVKRNARRKIRSELRLLAADPTAWEDWRMDLGRDTTARIRWVVEYERRSTDKLWHFCRWAERVTLDLPWHERLACIQRTLPKNLIGEHALNHLKAMPHFEHPNERACREEREAAAEARRPSRSQLAQMLIS